MVLKKLGQHFLKNTAALTEIAAALELARGECVIEIGPGHGELTIPVLREGKDLDGGIIAIEKDHTMIAGLQDMGKAEAPGRLTIIEGDALKILPGIVSGLPATTPYKIVGNIPYYITGKLLRIISELERRPQRVVLLIQKEVAERICATPPAMNRLAASVQFWAHPEIIAVIPRKDFSPPPNVDSAIIVLDLKTGSEENKIKSSPTIEAALYYKAVRAIFAQPRKTLLNNLASLKMDGVDKNAITVKLGEMGIDSDMRPQDLDVDRIIAIAKANLLQ